MLRFESKRLTPLDVRIVGAAHLPLSPKPESKPPDVPIQEGLTRIVDMPGYVPPGQRTQGDQKPSAPEMWLVIGGQKSNLNMKMIREEETNLVHRLQEAHRRLRTFFHENKPPLSQVERELINNAKKITALKRIKQGKKSEIGSEKAYLIEQHNQIRKEMKKMRQQRNFYSRIRAVYHYRPPLSTDRKVLTEHAENWHEEKRRLHFDINALMPAEHQETLLPLLDQLDELHREIYAFRRLRHGLKQIRPRQGEAVHEALLRKLNDQINRWKGYSNQEPLDAFSERLPHLLSLSATDFIKSIGSIEQRQYEEFTPEAKDRKALVSRIGADGFQDESHHQEAENKFQMACLLGPVSEAERPEVDRLKHLFVDYLHRHGFPVRLS